MAEGMASTDPPELRSLCCDLPLGYTHLPNCRFEDAITEDQCKQVPASSDVHEGLRLHIARKSEAAHFEMVEFGPGEDRDATLRQLRAAGWEVVEVMPVSEYSRAVHSSRADRHFDRADATKAAAELESALEVERRRTELLTRLAEAHERRANVRRRASKGLREQEDIAAADVDALRSALASLDAGDSGSDVAVPANSPQTAVEGGGDGRPGRQVEVFADEFEAGRDPFAPDGPLNDHEWDLCAAAWREVARRRAVPVDREARIEKASKAIAGWAMSRTLNSENADSLAAEIVDALSGVEGTGEPGDEPVEMAAMREILADPEAAIRALPEAEQKRYRDAQASIVQARQSAAAHGDDVLLGARVDAQPEREDGGPSWALAKRERDDAYKARDEERALRKRDNDEWERKYAEARAEVERLTHADDTAGAELSRLEDEVAYIAEELGCARNGSEVLWAVKRLRAAVPLSTETLRNLPGYVVSYIADSVTNGLSVRGVANSIADYLESQSPPSPAGDDDGLDVDELRVVVDFPTASEVGAGDKVWHLDTFRVVKRAVPVGDPPRGVQIEFEPVDPDFAPCAWLRVEADRLCCRSVGKFRPSPAVGLTVEEARALVVATSDSESNYPADVRVIGPARRKLKTFVDAGAPATDCIVAIVPGCNCWVGFASDKTPESARDVQVRQWEESGLIVERATVEEARAKLRVCEHGAAVSEAADAEEGDDGDQ